MKRKTFQYAVAKFHKGIVRKLCSMDYAPELAEDAVQNMVCRALAHKLYTNLAHDAVDGRIRKYLTQAAIYEVGSLVKQQAVEEDRTMQTQAFENEQDTFSVLRETAHEPTPDDVALCPFCHIGILNQYCACGLCNTILGQGKRLQEVVDIEELTLSDWPDLGLQIDVSAAMATLTVLERKLVTHIVHGNDTLDDMRALTGHSRSMLGRIFVEAKRKLQVALYEYAPA